MQEEKPIKLNPMTMPAQTKQPKKLVLTPWEERRRYDYKTDREGVIALTKEEVTHWMNNLGANYAQNNPKDMPQKEIETMEAQGFSRDAMQKLYDAVATREERQKLLERLGITDKTGDDYRLVFYNDKSQHVVFRGTMDEKTGNLTLVERTVLQIDMIRPKNPDLMPDDEKEKLRTSKTPEDRTKFLEIRKQETKAGMENYIKFFTEPMTPLPKDKSIVIPFIDTTKIGFPDTNDTRGGERPATMQKIELSPEELKKLETKVTLIALADKAMNGDVKVAGSNASLPNRGPASEVGLA